MRVHAPKLIYSTGVSNLQTFKLVFCMYNKPAFTRCSFKLVSLSRHFVLDPNL